MKDWVLAIIALLPTLLAFHHAAKGIERATGRPSRAVTDARSAVAFVVLTLAGIAFCNALVPTETAFPYIAYGYGVVAGFASLATQYLFGRRPRN